MLNFAFLKPQYIMYMIIVAALGFAVYTLHFKPINTLKKQQVVCCNLSSKKDLEIKNLELNISNLEQKLLKAKADIEVERFNTELCEMRENVLTTEDNTTIKDTADEGYLIF